MKLGEEGYWQIGDKVYSHFTGRGTIETIKHSEYSLHIRGELDATFTKEGYYWKSVKRQELFHIGAITFDAQDRPITINYDYVPKRTPKVMVTKLPHEFVEGEEVLVDSGNKGTWIKGKFNCLTPKLRQYSIYYFLYDKGICGARRVIPYIGNEHMQGTKVLCDSGKIPDDYVFPEIKEEIFRKAKIGDTVYRLYNDEYVKGIVTVINDKTKFIVVETEKVTKCYEELSYEWAYNFYGELGSMENIGQVLFWEDLSKNKKPYEHTFKPFDKVLVRHSKIATWEIDFFSSYGKDVGFRLRCLSGYYEYCIPFEGNEKLLGTIDNPEE